MRGSGRQWPGRVVIVVKITPEVRVVIHLDNDDLGAAIMMRLKRTLQLCFAGPPLHRSSWPQRAIKLSVSFTRSPSIRSSSIAKGQ